MPPYDQCCEGLVAVSDCEPGVPCPISLKYCVACGDGVCGEHENMSNCLEDCAGSEKCVSEGETGPVVPGAPGCCLGLVKIGIELWEPEIGVCVTQVTTCRVAPSPCGHHTDHDAMSPTDQWSIPGLGRLDS